MGKEALVVQRRVLFSEGEFQGFLPLEQRNMVSTILTSHSYHPRGESLENNMDLQQVIPYVWIVNPADKKIFLYRRAINQNKLEGEYKETRYLNKYSGGVGGHIDRDTEEGSKDPILKAMMRELREEVEMVQYPSPKIVGYIKDDSDSIGKVHFGIVAIAETLENVKSRTSEGLSEGKFYSVDEVEKIFSDKNNQVENWTSISWPVIKNFIQAY